MREITVRAKPSASADLVEKVTESEYIVRTIQPPVGGRANRAIIELLAEYFAISPSRISIVSGATSRSKRISIL